jgi:hypothetical protein
MTGDGGSVNYNVNHKNYLPCSIVLQNPRYIRDNDVWEIKALMSSMLLRGIAYGVLLLVPSFKTNGRLVAETL